MIGNVQVYRPGMGLIYPYDENGRLVVEHGDTIRVHVEFNYRQPEGFTCDVIVYLGTREHKGITSTVRHTLPPAHDFTPASSINNLEIKKPGLLGGGVQPGIYNLGVEIPQGNAYYEIPAAVEVKAAPGVMDQLGGMITMIIVVMMMSMMMQTMEDM